MLVSPHLTWTSHEDDLIVGAGPIGLACAISARRRRLDPLVIDAGAIVNSIVHYPIGMRADVVRGHFRGSHRV